jgi:hypothetical protein
MGGLLFALLLNSLPVFRVQTAREQNEGFAVTLRIRTATFNLVVLGLSGLLLGAGAAGSLGRLKVSKFKFE